MVKNIAKVKPNKVIKSRSSSMCCNFAIECLTCKQFGLLNRSKKALIMLFSLLEYYA